MNSNGALLLTWLLETSDLHGRYALLTSRLLPHLPMLCTHKVASNTILRIINQRQDIPAQQAIISSIFDEKTAILEQLLLDQTHGLSMVQRMLASAHIEQSQRSALVTRVRSLLLNLHVDSSPGFTRVLSELAAGNIAAAQPPPRASPIPKKTNHNNRRDRDQQQQPNAHQQVPFGSPGSLTAAQFPMFMQNGAAPGTPTNMRPNLPAGPPGALGLAPPFNVSQQASRPVRSSASGEHGLSLPTSIVPPAYASANGLPFVSDFASPCKSASASALETLKFISLFFR